VRLGGPGDPVLKPRVAMVVDLGESGADRPAAPAAAAIVALKTALADARAFARNRAGYDEGDQRPFDLSAPTWRRWSPSPSGASR
jgi:hypothetical protein